MAQNSLNESNEVFSRFGPLNSEDNINSMFFTKKKKIYPEKQIKEATSYVDLFNIPQRKVPKQLNQSWQNSFKIFMIRQNVKRFVHLIIKRTRIYERINQRHLRAINDKGADDQHLPTQKVKVVALREIQTMRKKRSTLPGMALAASTYLKCKRVLEFCFEPVRKIGKTVSKVLGKYIPVIEPEAQFARFIDQFKMVIQSFYIYMIPVDIAFELRVLSEGLFYLNLLFQVFFLMIILLNFTKAAFKDGQLVQERSKIIEYYLGQEFWEDVISLLGLSVALMFSSESQNFSIAQLTFYIQLMPLLQNTEQYSRKGIAATSRMFRHIVKFVSLLMRILFAEHIFACLFFFVSRVMSPYYTSSFIDNYELRPEQANFFTQYVTAFYFSSTTMITVGYGEFVPQNNVERILVVLFYLFSSIQLSYSVNTIGNIIQDMKNETEQNQQKIRLINEYMETKNVSNQLQIQIREYLNYYWREQEAEQHMSLQQDIVNELPLYLKSKLLKEANQNIIKECPLFKKFEFSDHLTKNIYKILQPLNLLPESLVETEKAKQDIAGPCIYFVEKGAVALQSNLSNSAVVIDEYDENEYFGLRDFIQGQETKLVYKSTQFSRLILLPLVDFMQILKNSQEDKEIFQDIKDSLIDKKIGLFCYACKEYTHSLISCQLTHYAPNYERVIKSYAFPVNQPRKKLTSRAKPHSCFSSWLDQALLHETAENYIEDNSKMMDGLYEIHSDIDTQEEYEEIEHPRQETRMNDEEEERRKIINQKMSQATYLKPTQSQAQKVQKARRKPSLPKVARGEVPAKQKQNEMVAYGKKNEVYSEEKTQYANLEKTRMMYREKMSQYLTRNDFWEMEYLFVRLKVLLQTDTDQYDQARSFNLYKPEENPDRVLQDLQKKIIRVKSKQWFNYSVGQMLYPGNKLLKLGLYMLYPQDYEKKQDKRLVTEFDDGNLVTIKKSQVQAI